MDKGAANSFAKLPFRFSFGPFRFESELDVPELRSSGAGGTLPVAIRLGGVPASIADGVPFGPECQVAAHEYLLMIAGVARYYVREGKEVRVEIEPAVPTANVTTYLLGSVFGVLCHQNGMLPLHASAVEHAGVVTAFLGESGAGKSTLAACLRQRGRRVVSDDICLLDPVGDAMRVIPVAGWLKLWQESLEHLGQRAVEAQRVFSTDDKFRVHLEPDAGAGELQLGHVVFLERTEDEQASPALEPMEMLEAIGGLIEMTYASYVPELSGQKARIFRQCASALSRVRAWRLRRPWGLERMEAAVDCVEREMLKIG